MQASKAKITALTAIALIVVATIGLSVWAMGDKDRNPDPHGDPIAIAKFLTTDRWENLAEDQKRAYMKTLRKHADAIGAALEQGKISKEEHDLAKHNIWLERQLDKMDEYYKLPVAQRTKYLDELVQSKIEKRKNPKPKNPNDPDTDEDSPFTEARKEQWPQEMEERWKQYLKALEAREKSRGL